MTEIEESVRQTWLSVALTTYYWRTKNAGKVNICRAPAFVRCVSNFSNFLDLSRKCLRNIELGVPAIILSRRNTTQHMYRWTKILVDLMEKHGVDPGLVTYAAFSLEDQQRIFKESPEGALYITCNREIAALVKSLHGNVMSSTGGPNTLVAPQMTQEISDAIRLSCMIENSGQCTALRHAYVGGATDEDMVSMFDAAPTISSPQMHWKTVHLLVSLMTHIRRLSIWLKVTVLTQVILTLPIVFQANFQKTKSRSIGGKLTLI